MADGDKTQEPTQHRRQEAREKGDVAQSQDLGSAALLLAAVLLTMTLGRRVAYWFGALMAQHLGDGAWLVADRDEVLAHFYRLAGPAAGALLPIVGLMVAAALSIQLAQVGFLWTPERISFDLSRISPLAGWQRLFSIASAVRLAFGLFKLLIVGVVAWSFVRGRWDDILALSTLETGPLSSGMADLVLGCALRIAIALVVLAILDYGFQWWKHEQDLKMTSQEIREEMKNLQGDPQVIARRRSVQRQLILNRLSSTVPKADVVVTNPTELAIAIQYDPEKMAAPVVLAKGAGVLAQRIRRLALEHQVPIVENKPLAQRLYREVDVNHPVPSETFAAVAEILAYVYQLKGKKMPVPA